MKKRYILIFLAAFALCAIWNIISDTPKPGAPPTMASQERSVLLSPVTEAEEQIYPYIHFHEAMENRIKDVSTYVAIGAMPKSYVKPSLPQKIAASMNMVPSIPSELHEH